MAKDERFAFGASRQPTLHVFHDTSFAGLGDWQVWLDTGIEELDGLCIGAGETRQAAVTDAVAHLEWALECLQGPPPQKGNQR